MAGVALGRLWDTHPRLAFALQLIASIVFGALLVSGLVQRDWTLVAVFAAGLLLEGGSLVAFTREAMAKGWTRSSW